MNKNSYNNRIISVLLIITLIITTVPQSVFALNANMTSGGKSGYGNVSDKTYPKLIAEVVRVSVVESSTKSVVVEPFHIANQEQMRYLPNQDNVYTWGQLSRVDAYPNTSISCDFGAFHVYKCSQSSSGAISLPTFIDSTPSYIESLREGFGERLFLEAVFFTDEGDNHAQNLGSTKEQVMSALETGKYKVIFEPVLVIQFQSGTYKDTYHAFSAYEWAQWNIQECGANPDGYDSKSYLIRSSPSMTTNLMNSIFLQEDELGIPSWDGEDGTYYAYPNKGKAYCPPSNRVMKRGGIMILSTTERLKLPNIVVDKETGLTAEYLPTLDKIKVKAQYHMDKNALYYTYDNKTSTYIDTPPTQLPQETEILMYMIPQSAITDGSNKGIADQRVLYKTKISNTVIPTTVLTESAITKSTGNGSKYTYKDGYIYFDVSGINDTSVDIKFEVNVNSTSSHQGPAFDKDIDSLEREELTHSDNFTQITVPLTPVNLKVTDLKATIDKSTRILSIDAKALNENLGSKPKEIDTQDMITLIKPKFKDKPEKIIHTDAYKISKWKQSEEHIFTNTTYQITLTESEYSELLTDGGKLKIIYEVNPSMNADYSVRAYSPTETTYDDNRKEIIIPITSELNIKATHLEAVGQINRDTRTLTYFANSNFIESEDESLILPTVKHHIEIYDADNTVIDAEGNETEKLLFEQDWTSTDVRYKNYFYFGNTEDLMLRYDVPTDTHKLLIIYEVNPETNGSRNITESTYDDNTLELYVEVDQVIDLMARNINITAKTITNADGSQFIDLDTPEITVNGVGRLIDSDTELPVSTDHYIYIYDWEDIGGTPTETLPDTTLCTAFTDLVPTSVTQDTTCELEVSFVLPAVPVPTLAPITKQYEVYYVINPTAKNPSNEVTYNNNLVHKTVKFVRLGDYTIPSPGESCLGCRIDVTDTPNYNHLSLADSYYDNTDGPDSQGFERSRTVYETVKPYDYPYGERDLIYDAETYKQHSGRGNCDSTPPPTITYFEYEYLDSAGNIVTKSVPDWVKVDSYRHRAGTTGGKRKRPIYCTVTVWRHIRHNLPTYYKFIFDDEYTKSPEKSRFFSFRAAGTQWDYKITAGEMVGSTIRAKFITDWDGEVKFGGETRYSKSAGPGKYDQGQPYIIEMEQVSYKRGNESVVQTSRPFNPIPLEWNYAAMQMVKNDKGFRCFETDVNYPSSIKIGYGEANLRGLTGTQIMFIKNLVPQAEMTRFGVCRAEKLAVTSNIYNETWVHPNNPLD